MKNLCCIVLLLFFSPKCWAQKKPLPDMYRGVLLLHQANGVQLPFNFDLSYKGRKPQIVIFNADEKIQVDEISIRNDSLYFKMPVFDTEFRAKIRDSIIEGLWINHYRNNERILPFVAYKGETRRFLQEPSSNFNIEGEWGCIFSPGARNSSIAQARFHHIEQTSQISGTFLTETGDYRFLEGVLSNDSLFLSAFDGSHAFLFTALMRNDSVVDGMFFSGSHWQEPWFAVRNKRSALRPPDKISYLSDSTGKISFSFKNLKGRTVSLHDSHYRNKAVIVQLMGSWCPNCMDESRYLSEIYDKYRKSGLEIIALAFERTRDEKQARAQLSRLKQRLGLKYEILVTGAMGKEEAGRILPDLNSVSAFPTTLFLDREHKVVKIYTGFNGPATGKDYEKFKITTESLIQNLIK